MSQRLTRASALTALVVPLIVAAAASAGGADTTRAEWSKKADAICKQGEQKQDALFDRSLDLTEAGKYAQAGRKFSKSFRLALKDARQLEKLKRPLADERKIQRYVDGTKRASSLAIESGQELGDGDLGKSEDLFARAIKITEKAERSVRGFDIAHCTE